MQRLRVYGCFTGETGEPKRLDLNEDGTFRLELHGGQMLAGSVREISPAHKVVTKDEEGNDVEGYEGEKLTLKPASPQKEAMTATMKDGGWFVELLGVSMQKTVPGSFSDSCQKALKANQVSYFADHTMRECLQQVEDAVHNSTFNHGVKPQLGVQPPPLVRRLAAADPTGPPPPRVQSAVEADDADLHGLSLAGRPVTIPELRTLCNEMNKAGSVLRLLDLSGSLDVKGRPPCPPEEVEKEMAVVSEHWGTVSEEESEENEKLEKLKAAIAPAEFVSVAQAFKHLAKERLNRMDMLLDTLRENTALTALDLSNNSLGTLLDGKKSFKQLRRARRALEDHSGLLTVNLSGNDMGPKGTGCIVKGLVQNVCVTSLDVSDNGIGDEEEDDVDEDAEADDPAFGEALSGLEAFADLLKKNKFMRELSLARNRTKHIELAEEDLNDSFGDDQPLYKFLAPLRTFHRLTSLDLSGNDLGPGGAYILGATLKKNTSLTRLDVSECCLGPRGVEALAAHLAEANALSSLGLRRNAFAGLKGRKNAKASAKAVATLCGFLGGDRNKLVSLDLAYNNLGSELCIGILEALRSSQVTSLDLSLNHLCGASTNEYSAEAAAALATYVQGTPIKKLSLQWNFLQAKGGAVLGEALQGSQVEEVDVSRNHLRGSGLAAVCQGASDKLRTLKAASNGACGEAAGSVAALLERSSTLQHVDVSDDKIGTDGCATILDAARRSSSLVSLNVMKNMIGAGAAPHVGEAAKHLKTLLAGDNDFGSAAVAEHVIPCLQECKGLRTLSVWGGEGSMATCLKGAVAAVTGGGCRELIELDLGLPLTELHEQTADVNAFTAQLQANLKAAHFESAAELVI